MKNSKRYFYALSDSFTGHDPQDYSSGFANTSVALAFETEKKRNVWILTTKVLKAKVISRRQAEEMTPWEQDGTGWVAKKVEVYGTEDVLILKEKVR